MKTVLYKASTRGHVNHGWLDTYHTFSFANYYNASRMNFGALRVLNDDTISGGEGFGTHPHNNMEIITIPLKGALAHKDNMGHEEVIQTGEVQVMSAGTGITHSEYNARAEEEVSLFQIWIFPDTKNVKPRYDQKSFSFENNKNNLVNIVSPSREKEGLWVHQNTWFHIGHFDKGVKYNYTLKDKKNGVFSMVIEGKFNIEGTDLHPRDAIGIYDTADISFEALEDEAQILLIEVPMGLYL